MSSEIPSESLTVHDLPRSHWSKFLHNFRWDEHPGLKDVILEFISDLQGGLAPHLLLTGPPGIGKTHIAVGLYRIGVVEAGMDNTSFIQVPQFCDDLKMSFDLDPEEWRPDHFARPMDANYLHVLDDIFGRPLSPWETENVLYRLISYAHDRHAGLVVTTNYTKDQLSDRMHPHELDRVLERCRAIKLTGKSKRL